MIARIKNANTDFTRFLEETIQNTVKVITKTGTLLCSGAVLSQHSEVIKQIVEKENEICLGNYKFAKECLTILHGGSVKMTEENCVEITKFGAQFGVADIVEQGLQYLASEVNYTNLKTSTETCYNASRLAKSCNIDMNIDYFWPLEEIMKKLSESEIEKFVTEISTRENFSMILAMMSNKALAERLLSHFIVLVNQSNIEEILGTFLDYTSCEMYAEAFLNCPESEIFLRKIEEMKLEEEQAKIFQNLKKILQQESETSGLKLKHNKEDLMTSWKRFTEEELVQVCKVFKTDFYILEVVMSWVALNKPGLKTVRHLCSLLDTTKLERGYLEHVMKVLKAGGHVVSFDLDSCQTGNNNDTFNIAKDIESITLMYGELHDATATRGVTATRDVTISRDVITSRDVTSRRISAKYTEPGWFGHSTYTYNVRVSKSGVVWEGASKGCTKLYGRTRDGGQIPFYTDVEAAVRADTVWDVSTLHGLKWGRFCLFLLSVSFKFYMHCLVNLSYCIVN